MSYDHSLTELLIKELMLATVECYDAFYFMPLTFALLGLSAGHPVSIDDREFSSLGLVGFLLPHGDRCPWGEKRENQRKSILTNSETKLKRVGEHKKVFLLMFFACEFQRSKTLKYFLQCPNKPK